MGHHPAYHVGNTEANAEDSYTSNPAVLNFVWGCTMMPARHCSTPTHERPQPRLLPCAGDDASADGIGTGIRSSPSATAANLDALTWRRNGTDVLSPILRQPVGAKGGAPLYN